MTGLPVFPFSKIFPSSDTRYSFRRGMPENNQHPVSKAGTAEYCSSRTITIS